MKKILWIAHPLNFRKELCHFPAHLAKLINGEVTAVFTEAGIYENIPLISNNNVFPTMEYRVGDIRLNDEKKQVADTNLHIIRSYFSTHGQDIHLHPSEGMSFDELIEQSRFSDLIVTQISISEFMMNEGRLSDFVKKMLAKAACPVLLMPDDHQKIEEVVFTYNGSDSSVYAIRQFTTLFEALHDAPVTILYVAEKDKEIPHRKEIISYLSAHYSDFSFRVLEGRPESELMTELMYRKNAIVTFGAFGRNSLSRLLHTSDSEKVMEIADLPVFITHP
jgi:nucleotide-binding universal stress UspA family protein